MNSEEFFDYLKRGVESEDYQGDFSKCDIEVIDTDGYTKGAIHDWSLTIIVSFYSPLANAEYVKKQLVEKLETEAKEKIRKQVYGE